MSKFVAFYKSARKAAVAGVGVVAQVVAAGVLTGAPLHWAQGVLAVATAFGVYQARNDAPKAAANSATQFFIGSQGQHVALSGKVAHVLLSNGLTYAVDVPTAVLALLPPDLKAAATPKADPTPAAPAAPVEPAPPAV